MPLASEVMTDSRTLLNDTEAAVYTNAALLPYLQRAYRDLQEELLLNGIPFILEKSAVIDVTAGAATVTNPTDLFEPFLLEERPDGSTSEEDWTTVDEKSPLPNVDPTDVIQFWEWREEAINFIAATTAREVRIHYRKTLPEISGDASQVLYLGSRNYMAAKCASYAARYIGENPNRANVLDAQAEVSLSKLIRIGVKGKQSTPIRRRPFWHHRRRIWQSQ